MSVIVVAAHPDDEVLGVGGTISELARSGRSVDILIVTEGSSSQYPGDDEIAARKLRQAKAACEELGASRLVLWDYPDMRLDSVPHPELAERLSSFIAEGGYTTVFGPNGDDVNHDHRTLNAELAVATRPVPGSAVRSVLEYPVNSSTEWGARRESRVFWSNYYVDISASIDTKLRALACYETEIRPFPHPRSIEAVEARARVTGSEVGFVAAESFRLVLRRGPIDC